MDTAAVYARVSSDAQRKEGTIAAQLRDVPAFCRARSWPIVEEYVDDGRSGSSNLDKREAFARLLADATAGRFSVVAVWSLDRLTRTADMRERGAILGAFQAAGVKVAIASTGQVMDFATDEGDLMGSFGAYSAAAENRRRRACTMAGKKTTIALGGKPSGSTPIGLIYTPPDSKRGIAPTWAVDPVWAVAIREVHERVAAGESTAAIALDLSRRPALARPRGGTWNDSKVRILVTSETYTGRLIVHRATGRSVPVPVVVDPELAAVARQALADRYQQPVAYQRHHHLLTRLARCGLCGARLNVASYTTRVGGEQRWTYLCATRRWSRMTGRTCDLPRMPVADLDALVWREVSDLLADEAVMDRAHAAATSGDTAGDTVDAAAAEVARLDQAQTDTHTQLAEGLISPEVADASIRRLGAARKAAQAALRDAKASRAGVRAVMPREALRECVGLWQRWAVEATPEQRRAVIRAAVERATVRPGVLAMDLRVAVPAHDDATSRSSDAARLPLGHLRIAIPGRRVA